MALELQTTFDEIKESIKGKIIACNMDVQEALQIVLKQKENGIVDNNTDDRVEKLEEACKSNILNGKRLDEVMGVIDTMVQEISTQPPNQEAEDEMDYAAEMSRKLQDAKENPQITDEDYVEQHEDYEKFQTMARPKKRAKKSVDDIEIDEMQSDSQVPEKCPISMMPLTNPMRSKGCGHIFSKEGIMSMLKGKQQIKCPTAGCNQYVSVSSLVKDRNAAIQLERQAIQKRVESQSRNDDDDLDGKDVIE